MTFFFFHLMPWPYLPEAYQGSAWITCPNSSYDPEKGTAVNNRYLDELISAAALGSDGVVVNEHHAKRVRQHAVAQPDRLDPRPPDGAGEDRVIGNALPLYNPPTRVAEEFAMLDVISGGRLIAGMVVGGGPEYYSNGLNSNGLNPVEARERFYEAHDLIVQAWTRLGPFEFHGKHYKLRYVTRGRSRCSSRTRRSGSPAPAAVFGRLTPAGGPFDSQSRGGVRE